MCEHDIHANQDDISEDRTINVRETNKGQVEDYEVIERTNFGTGYPEKTVVHKWKYPLFCGHHVTKVTPFFAYCQRKKLFGRCNNSMCERCSFQCVICGVFTCSGCLHKIDGENFCNPCASSQRSIGIIKFLIALIITPFISEDNKDES